MCMASFVTVTYFVCLIAKWLEETPQESCSKFTNTNEIVQLSCPAVAFVTELSWFCDSSSHLWKWTKPPSSVRRRLLPPLAVYGWKPILLSSQAVWRMDEGKNTYMHAGTHKHSHTHTAKVVEMVSQQVNYPLTSLEWSLICWTLHMNAQWQHGWVKEREWATDLLLPQNNCLPL